MLPKFSGFLLKDQTKLYDNVAEFDSKHGRLSAMLNINPAPRIEWELEVIGESSLDGFSVLDYQNNVMPIEGHHFSIPEPYVTQSSSHVIGPINSLVGVTANAYYYYANRDYLMNRFIFLLPNFRIQEASMTGQEFIRKRSYKQEEPEEFLEESSEARELEIPLNEDWTITLKTNQEALNWLDRRKGNIGTYVTTSGYLYPKAQEDSGFKKPSLSLLEACKLLDKFCIFISFANGGYLGPLYIEGQKKEEETGFLIPSARVMAYRTTPIEQIGPTWLTESSDISAFMKCFSSFEKIWADQIWKESYNDILFWYFQAIQPQNAQSLGKPWPIVANAIAAALERISHTILVYELKDKRGKSVQRIEKLLLRMGIPDSSCVNDFFKIRNEATHPLSFPRPPNEYLENISRAIQWLEEILLWRLGYQEKYRDRNNKEWAVINPRYDLSKREITW